MKTKHWLVAAIICYSLFPRIVQGQCSNTIQTVSYSNTVTGSGTTGTPYTFTFPKFDGSQGTLLQVNVTAILSLSFDYNVENRYNTDPVTFKLKVNRYDEITSSSLLDPLGYGRVFPSPSPSSWYGNFELQPNDGVNGSGTDFNDPAAMALLNNATIINEDLSNTADFMGSGNVTFEYATTTGPTLNVSGTEFISMVQDKVTFRITYTYCDNIVMAPGPSRIRPEEREEVKKHLTPNPSSTGNFTIYFSNKVRGDWQVEVFGPSGQLVNRKLFYNSLNANVHSNEKLPSGIYIVKATNLKSHEGFIERLVVR